jgi:Ca2+-binding EF-hand superfamily protein
MDEMDSKLAADILSAKDTDSSGSLSASELGGSSSQVSEYDTDGDGVVSAEELAAGLKAKREKMQAQMSNQMQQSGQMGMLQASMGQSSDMSAMDTKMSKSIISEKDTNKDGVLSADELGVSASNLSTVDTDGDGSVSESELTASLKSNREKMMADNGGQMPAPPDGAQGTSGTDGKPNIDNLISSLFSNSTSSSSTSTSTTTSTSSSDTSSTTSLTEYLKRQKASSAYMNMDKLIADLFGSNDETSQAVSVSA